MDNPDYLKSSDTEDIDKVNRLSGLLILLSSMEETERKKALRTAQAYFSIPSIDKIHRGN